MPRFLSPAYYLIPILNGLLGSIILWWILKDDEHPRAPKIIRNGWIIGFVMLIAHLILWSSVGMTIGFSPLF